MDVHRGHLSTEFQGNLSSCQTQTAVIPAGCCCRLQPLDVCVAQVLRDHLMVLPPTCVWPRPPFRLLNALCLVWWLLTGSMEPARRRRRAGRPGTGTAGSDAGLLGQRGFLHPELQEKDFAQVRFPKPSNSVTYCYLFGNSDIDFKCCQKDFNFSIHEQTCSFNVLLCVPPKVKQTFTH